VAGSKQNIRVWIVSVIALAGARATMTIKGTSPAQPSRRRSIQVEYDEIEYGGLPVKPLCFMEVAVLQCIWDLLGDDLF
jgi:hypothetical protein